ncbi:FGGY family carbohydrate kinase [Pseudaquabacterium rugosum]|uniref:FGGY family carbohydrate kinase n=1 Tax=Pseudaquabacterium rugosum TaxID=2984194 RepID=A0ABU9BEC0_9BURK
MPTPPPARRATPVAVLAIDQGTSATKCVLVADDGRIVAKASAALGERYPEPGWVEQDAEAVWDSVRSAVAQCLALAPDVPVRAVGLSTQRESALVWRRADAQALTPLLSWQDRRTVALRDTLAAREGVEAFVRDRSGLPLDPMFSALKLRWLLDRIDPQRTQAASGAWCVGTVDAFVLARLGAEGVIEAGNASRTQLLDVARGAWDAELLALFDIPEAALPRVVPSIRSHAEAGALHPRLAGVPVTAVMADSHAALFAHGARAPGEVKATMGTGSSVMGLTDGSRAAHPGLCRTIAWDLGAPGGDHGPVQALEGNIRAAGATLRWAADLFGLDSEQAAEIAARHSAAGLALVPGFTGLGAPWWDSHAVGLISGLTLATDRGALLAAAVDAIAHQVADVLAAMDASVDGIGCLRVDGGPSRNAALRAMLAGCIDRPVVYCADAELSALGVAHAAGLGIGLWSAEAVLALPREQQTTAPDQDAATRARITTARRHWARAVAQARLRG